MGTRIGAAALARGDGGRAGERAVWMERAGGLEQRSGVDCRWGNWVAVRSEGAQRRVAPWLLSGSWVTWCVCQGDEFALH